LKPNQVSIEFEHFAILPYINLVIVV
jgi:hypothetical protein